MIKKITATFMTVDSLQELIVRTFGFPYPFKSHSFELGAHSSQLFYTVSAYKSELSETDLYRVRSFENGDFHRADVPVWAHWWPRLETLVFVMVDRGVLEPGMYIFQRESEEFHS